MADNINDSGPPLRFTDYPDVEHREDYAPAREYLRQRSSEISGLLGLYEYGSVGAPGISDIDLIAVIDSSVDKQEILEFLSGTNAPPHVTRVLDQGTIKPMSESLFRRINVLGTIATSPIYAPNPITPPTPNIDDRTYIDAANVIDWLPERILMLRSLLGNPTLSCRRVLGGLGSFRHSASTVTDVLGYEPTQSTEFANSYDNLRSKWFDQTQEDNFKTTVEIIKMGIDVGQSLLPLVTAHLIDMKVLNTNESAIGSRFWLNSSKVFVFDTSSESEHPPIENSELLAQIIPPAWAQVIANYAEHNGKISSLIDENFEPAPPQSQSRTQKDFGLILSERIEWINESFEFLEPLGLTALMYRFSHLRTRTN